MKTLTLFFLALSFLGSSPVVLHASEPASTTPEAASSNILLARSYVHGMEKDNLDDLDDLFLPDGKSVVLENTSEEGSWEHYRDHHLKPETEGSSDFRFIIEKETELPFGSQAVVYLVGYFTVKVGEETRKYRSAVSFLIVDHEGSRRIAYLHWASRAAKS